MYKKELLEALSDETGFAVENCEQFLKAFIKIIMNEVKAGRKVHLIGFGYFDSKIYKEKEARNPRTGKPVHVKEIIKPFFKPGRPFKDFVREP